MPDPADDDLIRKLSAGDATAFEHLYYRYETRLRLAAWRIANRGDWIDDLVNETWRRAYERRAAFDSSRPFLVWLIGILRNVFREHCRTWGNDPPSGAALSAVENVDPGRLAAEAELLAGLNECVSALPADEQEMVRLRFFEGQTLKAVAQRLKVPESTLRDLRLPAVCDKLRACLKGRGLEISQFFSALQPGLFQFKDEERG